MPLPLVGCWLRRGGSCRRVAVTGGVSDIARISSNFLPEDCSGKTRRFANPPMETTEAAIHPTRMGDLFAVVGTPVGDGAYQTRLYRKPLINLLWTGALLMAFGGLVSLSDRRHRVGAPSRRRVQAAGVAAQRS